LFRGYEPESDSSSSAERRSYWQVGIGLQQVDGLTVSQELVELSEANIQGLVGYDAVEQTVIDNYRSRDLSNTGIREGFEADLVAARITRLLSKNGFILSIASLKAIHRELFQGLELLDRNLTPGEFKDRNWRKSERILYGQSVQYGSADTVEDNLREAIADERKTPYILPFEHEGIARLSTFCSLIWQIHPFSEGNTRTVAVFIEKYLRSMGLPIDNSHFELHSVYFRDALVRSCFADAQLGVSREPLFLQHFFENLLLGTNHAFVFQELYVEALDDKQTQTSQTDSPI